MGERSVLPFTVFAFIAFAWYSLDFFLAHSNPFADMARSLSMGLFGIGAFSFGILRGWKSRRSRLLLKGYIQWTAASIALMLFCCVLAYWNQDMLIWPPTLSLFSLGAGFAITANPLVHTSRIITRAFLYFWILVAAGICGVYFLSLLGLQGSIASIHVGFLVIVFAITVLSFLHLRYIRLPLSFLFYREVYQKEKILGQFIQEVQTMENARESQDSLLEIILQNIYRAIPFEKSILVTSDLARGICVRTLGPPSDRMQLESIKRKVPFLRMKLPAGFAEELDRTYLLEEDFPLPFVSITENTKRFRRVTDRIREGVRTIAGEGCELFLPLLFKNEIWGLIFLGRKASGLPYFNGELRLLEKARPGFAMALRNHAVIEDLRAQSTDEWNPARKIALSSESVFHGQTQSIKLGDRILIFADLKFKALVDKARQIAGLSLPVLIQGETGTGKELMARLLHVEGSGQATPFVPVNCAAIPAGLWESQIFGHKRGAFTGAQTDQAGFVEQANGGVLFFDEIGEMPLDVQPKILRLIQEKTYQPVGARKSSEANCRLVFATHRDLEAMCRTGQFREDLYYRINVHQLLLPPLRDRRKELAALVQFLIDKYSDEFNIERKEITPEVLDLMGMYDWPGNIRELENCVVRCLTESSSSTITRADLPAAIRTKVNRRTSKRLKVPVSPASIDFERMIEDYARELLVHTLRTCNGNQTRAARMLNISRGKLIYQMKELRLN
ncbi:MAG: sigma 54-interacting transcriptional regulator [Spirochaetia bacterium]|nr:sigma 54-interacting transcriptional regulator [Spirochaetia bacterium]